MRLAAIPSWSRSAACLDDDTITMLAQGDLDATLARHAFAHLVQCGYCCHELASVARLFDNGDVRAELGRLAQPTLRRRTLSLRTVGGLAAAAAAAALLFGVVRPVATTRAAAKPLYREQSFTAGVPPILVGPIGTAAPTDTFRWKAVARANRYRLTVFNRDGSVVLETETRDTAVALPMTLYRTPDHTFFWRVDVRVGWEDRWTESEMAPLILAPASAR